MALRSKTLAFIRFLKDERIYYNFQTEVIRCNCKEYIKNNYDIRRTIEENLQICDNPISSMMVWENTKQGEVFWLHEFYMWAMI